MISTRDGDGQEPRARSELGSAERRGRPSRSCWGDRGMRLGLGSVKLRSCSAGLCTGFPGHTGPCWGSAGKGRFVIMNFLSFESICIFLLSQVMQCSASLDVLFLLDGSYSIGKGSFERSKHFASKLCDAFDIHPDRYSSWLQLLVLSLKKDSRHFFIAANIAVGQVMLTVFLPVRDTVVAANIAVGQVMLTVFLPVRDTVVATDLSLGKVLLCAFFPIRHFFIAANIAVGQLLLSAGFPLGPFLVATGFCWEKRLLSAGFPLGPFLVDSGFYLDQLLLTVVFPLVPFLGPSGFHFDQLLLSAGFPLGPYLGPIDFF
ncbi:hypothetical protein IHE44_0001460 [Lamprotornis superbus]|uniref:VWFA domain-containing protein n=1 Tax=Lamprotornis superbus TaxID=245042 RepID=A0A835TW34_9PASS|nr:hypothetical protein IHE44_0001460 [Lamprotornis superbus]